MYKNCIKRMKNQFDRLQCKNKKIELELCFRFQVNKILKKKAQIKSSYGS